MPECSELHIEPGDSFDVPPARPSELVVGWLGGLHGPLVWLVLSLRARWGNGGLGRVSGVARVLGPPVAFPPLQFTIAIYTLGLPSG